MKSTSKRWNIWIVAIKPSVYQLAAWMAGLYLLEIQCFVIATALRNSTATRIQINGSTGSRKVWCENGDHKAASCECRCTNTKCDCARLCDHRETKNYVEHYVNYSKARRLRRRALHTLHLLRTFPVSHSTGLIQH